MGNVIFVYHVTSEQIRRNTFADHGWNSIRGYSQILYFQTAAVNILCDPTCFNFGFCAHPMHSHWSHSHTESIIAVIRLFYVHHFSTKLNCGPCISLCLVVSRSSQTRVLQKGSFCFENLKRFFQTCDFCITAAFDFSVRLWFSNTPVPELSVELKYG